MDDVPCYRGGLVWGQMMGVLSEVRGLHSLFLPLWDVCITYCHSLAYLSLGHLGHAPPPFGPSTENVAN